MKLQTGHKQNKKKTIETQIKITNSKEQEP